MNSMRMPAQFELKNAVNCISAVRLSYFTVLKKIKINQPRNHLLQRSTTPKVAGDLAAIETYKHLYYNCKHLLHSCSHLHSLYIIAYSIFF